MAKRKHSRKQRRHSNPSPIRSVKRTFRRRSGGGGGMGAILGGIKEPLIIAGGMKLAELLNNKVFKNQPVEKNKDGNYAVNWMAALAPIGIGLGLNLVGAKLIPGDVAKSLSNGFLVKGVSTLITMATMTKEEVAAVGKLAEDGNLYFLEGLGQSFYNPATGRMETGMPEMNYQPVYNTMAGLSGSSDYKKID